MQINRREFLMGGAAALVATRLAHAQVLKGASDAQDVWYRRVRRWWQINLTEDDPVNFDFDFWRKYWKNRRRLSATSGLSAPYAFSRIAIDRFARALAPAVSLAVHWTQAMLSRLTESLGSSGSSNLSLIARARSARGRTRSWSFGCPRGQ